MNITESKFRQIIREEAKKALQEMPYAGSIGVRQSRNQDRESFTSGISTGGANRAGAEKYARSGRFETLAKKHFANIPYDVWTAALIGAGDEAGVDDEPEFGQRSTVLDLYPKGIEHLKQLGFNPPANVGKNNLVILYTAMATDPEFLATPWMVMHSIFDTNSMVEEFIPGYRNLYSHMAFGDGGEDDFNEEYWYYGIGEEGEEEDEADESDDDDDDDSKDPLAPLSNLTDSIENQDAVLSTMTMNSAMKKKINSGADILPEMIVQELITKGGININFETVSDNPKIERALRELIVRVKKMAADFRRNAQGKLIVTATN